MTTNPTTPEERQRWKALEEATKFQIDWGIDGGIIWIAVAVDGEIEGVCCGQFNNDGSCCGDQIPMPSQPQWEQQQAGGGPGELLAFLDCAGKAMPRLIAHVEQLEAEVERLNNNLTEAERLLDVHGRQALKGILRERECEETAMNEMNEP